MIGSRLLEECVLFESRKQGVRIIVGPVERTKSLGSDDTNTYNLYICLFTGIFLDNRGSRTKIRTENELK